MLPGKIFRSPMPFSKRDPGERLWDEYLQANIKTVVLLAGDEECMLRAKRDLFSFYKDAGLDVITLPVPDYNVPEIGALELAVENAYQTAKSGTNVVIHCYAGVGRTGLFAACLARRAFGYSGERAVSWIRQYIPGAVETAEQEKIVEAFALTGAQIEKGGI